MNGTRTIRGGLSRRAGLALCLLSGLLVSCASRHPPLKTGEEAPTIDEREARSRVFDAEEAVALAPDDPVARRVLIQTYLDARRFPQAYEHAQGLLQVDPDDEDTLVLLGHASFGLGLFDEAAACFHKALGQVQSDDTSWWLGYILATRGNRAEARKVLDAAIDAGSVNWKVYELRVEIAADVADKLKVLEHYRQIAPESADAAKLGGALLAGKGAQDPALRIVEGAGQVIRARLSDYYNVSAKLNGLGVTTRVAVGRDDLILSEAAAIKLGLVPTGVANVSGGIGGQGISQALEVTIQRLELGNLTLENVPARVVRDLNTTEIVAQLGTGLLPGYACRLDRRREVLELYPPGHTPPAPEAGAVTQRYYRMGDRLITDAVVHNRIDHQRWKLKMALATDLQVTVLDRSYARLLDMGKVLPDEQAILKDLNGYTRVTSIDFAELQFGGNNFTFDQQRLHEQRMSEDRLWLAELPAVGGFVPYGLIGRNVLSRYRITLDPATQHLTLETYR